MKERDERERETCTIQKREGKLPTEGDPAHKGGRERPAQKRGEILAQQSLKICKQRERDGCTERAGKPAQRKRPTQRERIAYTHKTCTKEKDYTKRANSLYIYIYIFTQKGKV